MLKKLVILPVLFYKRFLSRPLHVLAGPMAGCRFTPSCSTYFIQAVEEHGALKGSLMGIWRILRCNPWGGCGHDPVPPRKTSTSSH
ncbi:MAG: membrane protein insertion efficiency factor YidD [Akkermansia sp.]|nr:membrane protein insertion efficiency factor YidD [Akkermansia sp.]MBQ8900876.1 membrane protein insertion efficiency factor YidD [Akkermansia sp.]MDO5464436.1 membrane protein insertion efficiency factor YidD [Akkermansia sp.]